MGQRLPAERDLARQLGVSRPVLREAMVALEIAGLVEVRTGSGIYVRAGDAGTQPVTLPDVGPSPFELIAARRLLEPEIAAAAATGASTADLDALGVILGEMEAALASGRSIRAEDRRFHTRIAAATGNTVVAAIVDQLWESATAPIFSGLSERVGLPENQRAAVAHHARIIAALRQRNPAAARAAMHAHLAEVEAIMTAEEANGAPE